MQIGMRDGERVAAGFARPAGSVILSAEKELRQPEREPLLSDSPCSLKEETGRKGSGFDALREARAQELVSVQVDDWHLEIW